METHSLSSNQLFDVTSFSKVTSKDPFLKTVVELYGLPKIQNHETNFETFVKIIINQQLSDAAATTILTRLKNLFQNGQVTAEKIIALPTSKLRNVGISAAKIEYIQGIAKIFCDKPNFITDLKRKSDSDLIADLLKIRGLGVWSCSIFALFYAGRPNIFVHGDVSIKKAIRDLYGVPDEKIEKFIKLKMVDWEPFNSITCLLLWHYVDSRRTQ